MATHELKSWPEQFGPIFEGTQRHEKRRNDRGFEVGDVLRLREWNPKTERYTGRFAKVRVTNVLEAAEYGLAEGYVMLGFELEQYGRRTVK